MSRGELDGATNVLVSARKDGRHAALDTLAGTDQDTVLVVSFEDDIDQWLADYRTRSGSSPGRMIGIGVDETLRSASTADTGGASPQFLADGLIVDTVDSATAVSTLGIKVAEYLQTAPEDTKVTVYFDSIPALLDAVDRSRAFRFLHILTGCVQQANATAYFLVEPDRLDAESQQVLRPLFDAHVDTTGCTDTAGEAVEPDC